MNPSPANARAVAGFEPRALWVATVLRLVKHVMPVGHKPLCHVVQWHKDIFAIKLVLTIPDCGDEMSVDADMQLRHCAMDSLIRRPGNISHSYSRSKLMPIL